MSVDQIVHIISTGGLLPGLLFILVAGMKKYWVFGWYVKEVKQDRDEWKEAALHGTRIASRAVDLAARKDQSNEPPTS